MSEHGQQWPKGSIDKAETREAEPYYSFERGDDVLFEGKKYKVAGILSPEKRGVPTLVLAPPEAPEDYTQKFDYTSYDGAYLLEDDEEGAEEQDANYDERYGRYIEADFDEVTHFAH